MAESSQCLLSLPAELIHHILTFLPPTSLAAASSTCRALRHHALSDQLWQSHVNDNLQEPLLSPSPLTTYRDLYIAHHPHWFLTRHKVWYSDSDPNGKLLVARYDARRGCIEAYAVVAERGTHTFQLWEHDSRVAVHSFNPCVQLDLNQAVLKLDIGSRRQLSKAGSLPYVGDVGLDGAPTLAAESLGRQVRSGVLSLTDEVLMDCSSTSGLYTSFMLSRDYPPEATGPMTQVWPPLRIPALSRTRNLSASAFHSMGHRPTKQSEVSQNTFRVRKWLQFGSRSGAFVMNVGRAEHMFPALGGGMGWQTFLNSSPSRSARMGEDVSTFGTLPPECYTPTKEKPWRGIWCGDYSGHGCEFITILQPDEGEESPLPKKMDWMREWLLTGRPRRDDENPWTNLTSRRRSSVTDPEDDTSSEGYHTASESPIVPEPPTARRTAPPRSTGLYSGRIEAVKLTGDPNIPRGEYTFIAPDIGDAGFVRIAEEQPFRGARVVRSAGHIAGRGYQDDEYMPSQLVLISHDRLAQYWEGFGHISFYQRVDIDEVLKL